MNALFVALQYLLPQHLLSRLTGWLAASTWAPLKNGLIRLFAWKFRVDMSEATEPEPTAYPHFNAFFTRALKDGARPLSPLADTLLCPADGCISEIGCIEEDRLLQAKGRHYRLIDLLGGDPTLARAFHGGRFATVYLSPKDYHRVHMPLDGSLLRTVYVPGRLFSVNNATAQRVPGLFARNERLVALFETDAGPMAMILVGAMIVAGIETVWNGPVTPPHRELEITHFRQQPGHEPIQLQRGDEMGRFYLGSTVILLFGKNRVDWLPQLQAGTQVRMGETFGRVLPRA